ncbi:TPA: Ldh family oxidoreductase, partial [Candidatus Bathyarchaeota archaeon]|nr:Ldh family oxidoreductase [Candidatus Bathyarchaeota archaeon]
MPVLSADRLRRISRSIFESAGAPREEARLVASLLVKANLQGHDSHGVIRIAQYVRDISEGKIRPGVEIAVAKETPTTAVVDGNWGFGQCVAEKSMQIAIRKAERYGLGAVTVFNCNHVGRLWDYTTMALDHDMIGFAAANGGRIVAPFGGLERMLHTAPISFAVPTGRERPFV